MNGHVSVVIPTYNRNDILLSRALPSVLRQTHAVSEVHIVADGMDPAPFRELLECVPDDHRIRLYNIPRQAYPADLQAKWCVLGLDARNFGLDRCSGDWIAPLDDDDEWTDDHVEALLRGALEHDAQFAYGMSQYHWPSGHFQQAGSWPPRMGAFCDGAQIYRNKMGYRYDLDCIKRGLPEDGDLWTRMHEDGVLFVFIDQVVHHYYPNER